jgi:RND family efflux transporter MFP subunit
MATHPLAVFGALIATWPFAIVAGPSEAPPPVQVVVVATRAVQEAFTLPGEVRARWETPLGFRVAGKIVRREVNVGQQVRSGDVLARLDDTDFRLAVEAQEAGLAAAEAELRLQRSEIERIRQLRTKNLAAQSDLDQRQTALDAAGAKVEAAKAQLAQLQRQAQYTTLSADEDGVVTGLDAEEGQVVGAGQPVVRVARLGEREVLVHVPETRIAAFQAAGKLRIAIPALRDLSWEGTLRELARQADPRTRTFAARVSLPATGDQVALGMSARVEVVSPSRERVLVPLAALSTQGDDPAVWVMDPADRRVRRVAVATEPPLGELVPVTRGLNDGDRVIVAGMHRLHDGQVVNPVDTPP